MPPFAQIVFVVECTAQHIRHGYEAMVRVEAERRLASALNLLRRVAQDERLHREEWVVSSLSFVGTCVETCAEMDVVTCVW